ncbi:MAG: EamA family transporter [Rhizobiales bacterium]|nr:EamA family transporter [Hyphomicrobiales bacterium]
MVYSNLVVKSRASAHSLNPNDGITKFVWSMLLDPWMWTAALATATAMFLYILTIRHTEITYAQPILALVFVVTPIMSYFILGEALSALRLTGIAFIALGILCVAQSA